MSSHLETLTANQAAYNQALNDYLDQPSEATLNNLKVVRIESGIQDTDLIQEITKRHLSEQKVASWDSKTKTREFSKALMQDPFKSKEFTVQRLMNETESVSILPEGQHTGLRNLTNTCFGNSTLQAFILTAPEIDGLLTTPLEKRKEESAQAFKQRQELQATLKALKNEYTKQSPDTAELTRLLTLLWTSDILKSSGLRPMDKQEDAPEFLGIILDNLDAHKQKEITYIEHSALHIKGNILIDHSKGVPSQIIKAKGLDRKTPTLQNTIDRMFATENVEHNLYDKKRIYYRSAHPSGAAPSSLAVQLPRFSFDRTGKKVQTTIKGFNQQIKVPFSDKDGNTIKHGIYQVDSVVCHFGDTLHSGHYIAVVRTEAGWEERNDSFVRRISEEEAFAIIEKNGYLVRMVKVNEM